MKKILKILLTILILVSLSVYLTLFSPGRLIQIKDEGMSPTIKYGQYLWLEPVSYRFAAPRKGDIVVYSDPAATSKDGLWDRRVGRIVAVPGDTIEIRGGEVFVNAAILDETYIAKGAREDTPAPGHLEEEMKLSKDSYIILADNRVQGVDSRYLGPIPRANIIGKVHPL